MIKAIIFGAGGQDGYYLASLLEAKGAELVKVGRMVHPGDTNLGDFEQVSKLIAETKPDHIFHLAAKSAISHEYFLDNYNSICTGTVNILESVKRFSPHTKVFISGSALQFRNDGSPINEKTPFEARYPYSLCRIQSVFSARYFRTMGIKAYVGYFFNHDSPRRSERHMTKMIAEAAKRAAAGSTDKIEIGDLNAVKEYSFAGDIAEGIWKLVNQDGHFEAVIGSGEGHSIADWLEVCFSIAGKNWKEYVLPKKDFIPTYNRLVSDPTLIKSLGWKPVTSFNDLAQLMMQS